MAVIQDYYDPWNPDFVRDPFGPYGPLLSRGPTVVDGGSLPPSLRMGVLPGKPVVMVARYADVVEVMRDSARFSTRRPAAPGPAPPRDDALHFYGAPVLLFSDPPQHTRLRRLMTRAFSPRRIRDMAPTIKTIVKELLDHVEAKGEFDVMRDLGFPLPMFVIAAMLGVTAEHYDDFKRWSTAIILADTTQPGSSYPPEAREATAALRQYFGREVEKRRGLPGDDLISVLVQAQEETDALTTAEVLAFVLLLLLAGSETTTNLIGNGLQTLVEHPDQFEHFKANPAMVGSAVEEILRFDPPVHLVNRYTTADTEVGGTVIPQGSLLYVMLGAANRDPAKFPSPDSFDITRNPNDHVTFGEGIHFCLGAGLSRLEGEIVLPYLFERFPKLRAARPGAPRINAPKASYYIYRSVGSLKMAID